MKKMKSKEIKTEKEVDTVLVIGALVSILAVGLSVAMFIFVGVNRVKRMTEDDARVIAISSDEDEEEWSMRNGGDKIGELTEETRVVAIMSDEDDEEWSMGGSGDRAGELTEETRVVAIMSDEDDEEWSMRDGNEITIGRNYYASGVKYKLVSAIVDDLVNNSYFDKGSTTQKIILQKDNYYMYTNKDELSVKNDALDTSMNISCSCSDQSKKGIVIIEDRNVMCQSSCSLQMSVSR